MNGSFPPSRWISFSQPGWAVPTSAEDGQEHIPVVLHRAVTGTTERFLGVIIEHYAGAFPVWLSPVQAVLIPIADRHMDYCKDVAAKLRTDGLRVEVDERSERMNSKIRDAQKQKIPYMLVVGDQEMENKQVALRLRNGENPGPMSLTDFLLRCEAGYRIGRLIDHCAGV